jgi:hypothetical protein
MMILKNELYAGSLIGICFYFKIAIQNIKFPSWLNKGYVIG